MKGNINMQKQKRITLNSEKRTAIANVFQSHFEREESPVMKKYYKAKETYNNFRSQMKIFVEKIVRNQQPQEDVDTIRSMIKKYDRSGGELFEDNIRKFQNDPRCRFLIGTPQTGGYGITLTQANTVIYYSNSYDLEKRLQSEDRAHRIGQKEKVTYVDLISEDTVDEKIVEALRNKINIASEVLGEELKEWI